ncbi:hypothetical protein [Anaerocolumna chitinilytica]|uniref:Uncharacterized protein n=1 Tax=Anaerocolumna chitinilytica TaxID=1727145 RepID=A0A7I8DJ19_9FIRM|nr:hypothetical protein [Anaerocolumna chitinilytica]BCJ98429.1 hypothetical protein bsdcttw_14700 [Anaerocolumna chitinilytica]
MYNIPKHIFSISLPSETSKEITEWFEVMESRNQLSDELIGLVHNHIMTGNYQNKTMNENHVQSDPLKLSDKKVEIQDDFLDKLYNWQDSNSAVFKEDKIEKKEKKKMLSI